jgi:hypothetical protein
MNSFVVPPGPRFQRYVATMVAASVVSRNLCQQNRWVEDFDYRRRTKDLFVDQLVARVTHVCHRTGVLPRHP